MPFGTGNQAQLSQARSGDAADVTARMGLAMPGQGRPVIVVAGGADGLVDAALERASAMLGAAVASAAEVAGAVVVDGGTSAGVMRLAGQARARWPDALPVLVGVAGRAGDLPREPCRGGCAAGGEPFAFHPG